jgi:hypothetical protein
MRPRAGLRNFDIDSVRYGLHAFVSARAGSFKHPAELRGVARRLGSA